MQNLQPPQTFNDGIISIYTVHDIAAQGETPEIGISSPALCSLRYQERMVGYNRYIENMQAGTRTDRLYRCLRIEAVTTKCVAVEGTKQYNIKQVQHPPDIYPPVMDLTLERIDPDAAYRI